MSKNLSIRERNRRKYRKMYNSIENKLIDNDIVWWNSLTIKSRYSIVFRWQSSTNIKLKHFLKDCKNRYRVGLANKRRSLIDHLIK
jgi:hypothetical protein